VPTAGCCAASHNARHDRVAYVLAHHLSRAGPAEAGNRLPCFYPLGRNANLFGTAHWHFNCDFIDSTAISYARSLR
jgi:hypothetical protein